MTIMKMDKEHIDAACGILEGSGEVFERLDSEGFRIGLERNVRRGTALCAMENGGIAGFVIYSEILSRISFLLVDKAYRGRGIGEALVRSAIDELDCGEIYVETYSDTPSAEPARALYRKLGFRVKEEIAGYDIPQVRMVLKKK